MHKEQWEYLKDISNTKSISATAIKFHISSQALGKSIKSLERELNIQLLIRSHTGVTLTEEAEKALILANTFFYEISQLSNVTTENKILKLPLARGLYEIDFSELLYQYKLLFPDYEILLESLIFDDLLNNIKNKTLDFGICSLLYCNEKLLLNDYRNDYSIMPFNSQKIVALVSANNPLASKKTISLMALNDYDYIFQSPNGAMENSLMHIYNHLGLKLPNKISIEHSMKTIINRIIFYNCVCLTVESYIEDLLKEKNKIKVLSLEENIKLKNCYLFRKQDNIKDITMPYKHLKFLNIDTND